LANSPSPVSSFNRAKVQFGTVAKFGAIKAIVHFEHLIELPARFVIYDNRYESVVVTSHSLLLRSPIGPLQDEQAHEQLLVNLVPEIAQAIAFATT
jgi:hypothetical protein